MPTATCPACDAAPAAGTLPPGDLITCTSCGIEYLPAAATLVTIHTAVGGGPRRAAGQVTLPPAFHRRYALGQVLGQGAMGMVVRGTRLADGATVAVKFLIRADDADLVKRFQREGQLMKEVAHPNVVAVLEILDLDGHPCLITEFLPGGTLRARMERGPLSATRTALLLEGALAGLGACHARGIVHRDLKPENVLFDEADESKIADLGIARAYDADSRLTKTGMILGTPRYMSPEQALGEPCGAPADVYAMACVAFEMLAGRPAFDGRSLHELLDKHIATPPPALDLLRPELPRPLVDLLLRAMAKRPVERPADATELRKLLAAAAAAPAGGKGLAEGHALPGRALRAGSQDQTLGTLVGTAPGAAAAQVTGGVTRVEEPPVSARTASSRSPRSGGASIVSKPPKSVAVGAAASKAVAAPAAAALAVVLAASLGWYRVTHSPGVPPPSPTGAPDAPVDPTPARSASASAVAPASAAPRATASASVRTTPAAKSPPPPAVVALKASARPSVRPAKKIASPAAAATPVASATPVATTLPASIAAADGSTMLLVPAGRFTMGIEGDAEARPHEVTLSACYLDRTEITNAQYQSFCDGTGWKTFAERKGSGTEWTGSGWTSTPGVCWKHPKWKDDSISGEAMNAPVAQLTWPDALAYCMWAGKRLPTEAEWECAARGGGEGRLYPWGDDAPSGRAAWDFFFKQGVKPVGQYGANGYGFYDMAGNVREWCADSFDPDGYALHAPLDPVSGPPSINLMPMKVCRGGFFVSHNASQLRCGDRGSLFPSVLYTDYSGGFRGARSDPSVGTENTGDAVRLTNGSSATSIGADLLALAAKQPRPDGLDAAANYLSVSEFLLIASMNKEALSIAKRAVAIRARLLPPNHPAQLVAAIAVANLEQDTAYGLSAWRSVTASATAILGPTHPLTGMCNVALSAMATAEGQAAEALKAADLAVTALDLDPLPHAVLAARAHCRRARALLLNRDVRGASAAIDRARAIAAERFKDQPENMTVDIASGYVLAAAGDRNGAAAAFDRALDWARKIAPPLVTVLQGLRRSAVAGRELTEQE